MLRPDLPGEKPTLVPPLEKDPGRWVRGRHGEGWIPNERDWEGRKEGRREDGRREGEREVGSGEMFSTAEHFGES